jgi:DNA-directed RNA polymerase
MKKLTDEEWQKVMDQTQGHKVARAFYEALRNQYAKRETPVYQNSKWEDVAEIDKEIYIGAVGELFDNGVIEGGNALPNL